jgi:hypothetical protein
VLAVRVTTIDVTGAGDWVVVRSAAAAGGVAIPVVLEKRLAPRTGSSCGVPWLVIDVAAVIGDAGTQLAVSDRMSAPASAASAAPGLMGVLII